MTTVAARAPLEPNKFVRNGKYPTAECAAELADHTNHVAMYRGKTLLQCAVPIASIPASGGDRVRHRALCVTSPYTTTLAVRASIAATVTELAADPYVKVTITNTALTVLGEAELHFGATAITATDAPNELGSVFAYVNDAGTTNKAVIPAGTTVYITVKEFSNARLVGLTVFDSPLLATAPIGEGYAVTTPVLDKDRQDIVTATRAMWKQQAGNLINFSVVSDSTPRTTTSITALNLNDGVSTAVSTATPGYTLDLRNRSTVRRGTVPCTFWCYADKTSINSGSVTLKNSAGTVLATLTISTNGPAWYSTTVSLPATEAKYDIHFTAPGGNSISVYQAGLHQYEA